MRILSISMSNIFRPRDGTAIAVYNRWMRLAKRHRVTMVVTNIEPQTEGDPGIVSATEWAENVIQIPGVPSRFFLRLERKMRRSIPWISRETGFWMNREAKTTVAQVLAAGSYDLVQVEPFPAFWTLPQSLSIPIAFNCNDISSRFVRDTIDAAKTPVERLWRQRQYQDIRQLEKRMWRRASVIFTVTALEAGLIRADVPDANVVEATHGVDLEFLKPTGATIRRNEIMFVGVLDVNQNIDAVVWFASDIMPIIRAEVPEAVFSVVGRAPTLEVQALAELPGVEVVGEVPDVRPYLARARVLVAPVRLGAGMKSKTVEAMAMKKPMVSTTFAAEGVKYTLGENILLGDTPEAMAREVIRVLQDDALATKLGENGRRLVEEQYSWEAIVETYDRAYRQIVEERAACV